MSRLVYEGNTKVYLLTAIVNKAAPTTAEIAAGKDLTPFITKDGVTVPSNQNMVDSATINDVFDAQQVGSWGGGPIVLIMFRDDTLETNGYLAVVYGTAGFLVISRFGAAIATKKVEVWPVQAHQPTMMQTAANEMQKFAASFAVTGTPTLTAVVA